MKIELEKIKEMDDLELGSLAVEILSSQEFAEKLIAHATNEKVNYIINELSETIKHIETKLSVADVISALYALCIVYLVKSLKR
ncbi:MAG: hypothetical protein QXV35_05265 [Archaeoglobaceae archaeon]